MDVKSPTRALTRTSGGPRGKDKGRDKGKATGSKPDAAPLLPEGPAQVHYTELFIFTVCSAPTGALPN